MRAIGCLVLFVGACATRPGFVSDSSARPSDDVAACTDRPCGGSADALKMGIGISVLVGLTIAKLWPDR